MNEDLIRKVMEEEVKPSIFEIGPCKAQGQIYSLQSSIISHWDVVKTDIIKEKKNSFSMKMYLMST